MQNIFPPVPFSEPNEHGVFISAVKHTIYEHKSAKAEVRLARSPAGYHCGYDYWMPNNGGCGGPFTGRYHPTQYEAETAALKYIKSFFSSSFDTIQEKDYAKKALAAIDKLLNTHRDTALSEVLAEIAALEAQLKKAA
jgi:hypothetical protein